MALSTVSTNNQMKQFSRKIMREYIRGNLFSPYMGGGINAIIQTRNELTKAGKQMNIPLVARLNGRGKGIGTLVGNEEVIDQYGFSVWIDWARNAVLTNKDELKKESAPIWDEARDLLSDWGTELQRDEIILAMHALPSASAPTGLGSADGQRVNGILYADATAAQKNTWQTANADRVLYGAATSNRVAGDHAASLANIDSTADKLSPSIIRLLKRRARNASPKIRPYRTEDGREYFVMFTGGRAFRDLSDNSEMVQLNQNARARESNGMNNNPLFQDGDQLVNGVIVREIPEMDDLTVVTGAGASSIDVAPVFLTGQSALAFAWGQQVRGTERREDDYDFLIGLGVEMAYGIAKVAKIRAGETALVDWGVATGYVSAVGD
jgi:hypothetical protein